MIMSMTFSRNHATVHEQKLGRVVPGVCGLVSFSRELLVSTEM